MTDDVKDAGYVSRSVDSLDGLKLHYRDYPGPEGGDRTPVLCVPGLTRNSRDFEALAPILAQRRRVLAVDLRGRGLSDYDPKPERYTPQTYAADCMAILAANLIDRVAWIGTSLGGMVGMGVAAVQPQLVAGLILNDVGPEIAPEGIERIQAYVGKKRVFQTWEECAQAFKEANAQVYPKFGPEEWMMMARRSFHWSEADGGFVSSYDKAVAQRFNTISPQDREALWQLWAALAPVKTLAIRGALSDILSAETLDRMIAEKPDLAVAIVPDVGHVPLLVEPEALAAIEAMLTATDPA